MAADGPAPADVQRHALFYQAKEGCGMTLARMLAKQAEAAADDPTTPIASSTIFQRDDVVVRLIDMSGALDARPDLALGISGARKAATLTRLLATGDDGVPTTDEEFSRFLARSDMRLITDRCASSEES